MRFAEKHSNAIPMELEKNGYVIPDPCASVFGVYPTELLGTKFVPLGENPPADYPYKRTTHPRILSIDKQSGRVGHNVEPAPCAFVDFEKCTIEFAYKEFGGVRKHHDNIRKILKDLRNAA